MPIVVDQFNSLFVGGNKGRKFEIRFCPKAKEAPWSVQSRGNGHYFQTLREVLSFAAGRGWIDTHMIRAYQIQIMDALARKWDEE